ncbi:uncharacterized protein LOC9648939 [Selaginella moellendorffii]|uniref:uncharacterized protein LOC9648939 n=1 Tax=Selaginella moellendorffii TaxID=88036 RepID=UPI000D1C29EF|nr:uncharacterized protein LOC9648939 [Selaginella moellendorffii]|eukprot:XP_002985014.2 uncharacterized protein LOC9648939 [Selaginella moellendorffii]
MVEEATGAWPLRLEHAMAHATIASCSSSSSCRRRQHQPSQQLAACEHQQLLHCFVQTSNKYVLGGSFSSISTPDSTQYEKTLRVFQDDSSKNWWLQIDGESIGYWPASLFQSLQNGAETLEAGGEVCYDKESGVRHTKTGMGSGEFPSQGYLKAAYQRRIQYLDSNGVMQPAIGMKSGAEVPKCYTATSVAADKGDDCASSRIAPYGFNATSCTGICGPHGRSLTHGCLLTPTHSTFFLHENGTRLSTRAADRDCHIDTPTLARSAGRMD